MWFHLVSIYDYKLRFVIKCCFSSGGIRSRFIVNPSQPLAVYIWLASALIPCVKKVHMVEQADMSVIVSLRAPPQQQQQQAA